jgi:hypothetical protein
MTDVVRRAHEYSIRLARGDGLGTSQDLEPRAHDNLRRRWQLPYPGDAPRFI